MRFVLTNSNCTDKTKEQLINEHPGLGNFNVFEEEYSYKIARNIFDENGKPIKQEIDRKSTRVVIEINNLEELISLVDALKDNPIIIARRDEEWFFSQTAGELEIEIYDGYRE